MASSTEEDFRVKVSSKRVVVEQLNRYKELIQKSFDGSTGMPEESKQQLLQTFLTTFESAVQDNILVNGQPWEDALDDEEDELYTLGENLDEKIVETVNRRRRYPKPILAYVTHTIKSERELMKLQEQQAATVPQVEKDPLQERVMSELSAGERGICKQTSSVMKSLQALQQNMEGLRQVLNTNLTSASSDTLPLPLGGAARSFKEPIKRALEEAGAQTWCLKRRAGEPVANGDR